MAVLSNVLGVAGWRAWPSYPMFSVLRGGVRGRPIQCSQCCGVACVAVLSNVLSVAVWRAWPSYPIFSVLRSVLTLMSFKPACKLSQRSKVF